MAKSHIIKFSVTPEQHERITFKANLSGYLHLAPYIRELVLEQDFLRLEIKMNEMYKVLKDIRRCSHDNNAVARMANNIK